MPYQYPYTNLHDLDLDWMLNQINNVRTDVANFTSEDNYNDIVNSAVTRVQNSDSYTQTMVNVNAAGVAATSAATAANTAATRANSAASTAENVSAIVAEAFSTSRDYSAGWYVTYSGGLYRFNEFHAAGAWDASQVTAITVGNQLTTLDMGVENGNDAFRYMHDSANLTWTEGTLDATGAEQSSTRSYYSDYIDLNGRNLYIYVPADGSITTRVYYYSDTNVESFGTRGTANTSARVTTNGTYRYCRILAYYTDSSKPRDENIYKASFYIFGYADNYRGKISLLGYTSFAQCAREGYYSFSLTDLPNITDKPVDLTSGGIIFTYTHFGSFTLYQELYDVYNNKYVRFGTSPFVKVYDTSHDYITPDYEIGAIASGSGDNVTSTKRVRMVSNADFNGGFILTVPENMKAEVITYKTDSTRGETVTSFLPEGTYYIYPRYGEAYFRIYGGYADDRTITNASVGNNFTLEYIDNADSPVWLALGDSITQGYYSYNNGSSDVLGRTQKCWATIAASIANLRLVNSGVGGSGYVHNGTVLDQKNAKDHVDTINFSGVDMVTLSWGVNDWKYGETIGTVNSTVGDGTLCGNMKYVIEKILTQNPNCKVFVVTPVNSANTTKDYGDESTNWGLGYAVSGSGTLEQVYQAEKDVADYYGIQLIDQTHTSVVNRKNLLQNLPDGVHPSLECHDTLGHEMSRKITF